MTVSSLILKVHVNKFPDLVEKYGVKVFPTFFMIAKENVVDKLAGLSIPELTKRIKGNVFKHFPLDAAQVPDTKTDLDNRLSQLINKSPVMLFATYPLTCSPFVHTLLLI